MNQWKEVLKSDPTDWLLETDNPSVRYFTQTDLLGETMSKQNLMFEGIIPQILAQQNPDGSWGKPLSFYTAKYSGTVWQTITLAALGADGSDPRVRKACEFLIENSQDIESGGFSQSLAVKTGGGRHSEVVPCLTGNLLWALIRLGMGQTEPARKATEWLTKYTRFDDGDGNPTGWPYDIYEMCWGAHTCFMGVVKALKAFAEIPTGERTPEVKQTIEKGAEFLLIHRIFRQSHNFNRKAKPGWLKLGFPVMYRTDLLEILDILTRLGYRDERMQESIDILIGKQNEDGRWTMENSHNDRLLIPVEELGAPSKWVTLFALRILKRWNELLT